MMKESVEQSSGFHFNRKCFWPSKGFHLVLGLACILFHLAMCGPGATSNLVASTDRIPEHLDNDACKSYIDNSAAFQDLIVSDISSVHSHGRPELSSLKNVCSNSVSFCFPSTLPGYVAEEDGSVASLVFPEDSDDNTSSEGSDLNNIVQINSSWSGGHANFILLNGRRISCSLSSSVELLDKLRTQKKNAEQSGLASCKEPSHRSASMHHDSSPPDGFSSPHVAINPPILDWGPSHLYVPSVVFLTVSNTCNDTILYIYEPSSTDPQLYPYDFEEITLAPGEATSISFVFFPRWLGSSTAHLILQTSLGGFLIRTRGLAIESPYGIPSLVGLNVSSDGNMRKNLSLHNPFNDILYIEELTAWVLVSSENISETAQAVCKLDLSETSGRYIPLMNVREWWNGKSAELGLPLIGLRPYEHRQVHPRRTETILEISLSPNIEGKVFAAFCIQLQSSSLGKADTIVVPLEAEVHRRVAYTSYTGSVSILLKSLVGCDEESRLVVLCLRNGAPDLLKLVKIVEVTEGVKLFQVKYMEGLILFPGTITYIAVVSYTPSDASKDTPSEIPSPDCKLLIVTNDSGSPQVEIPCKDLVRICSRCQLGSHFSASGNSYAGLEFPHEKEDPGNSRTGSLGSINHEPLEMDVSKAAQTDELILRNWKSQRSTNGMSVLEGHELLFSVVEVGNHCSKWIAVKNPSHDPVTMQLVLNSGVVIDECKDNHELFQNALLSTWFCNDSSGIKSGFSIADAAVTEAFVQPYGKALFGPIIFHPSDRCAWKGSALIRNNLSGVEWLSLHGFGGVVSLILLEGPEPVQHLEFIVKMPSPLNISPSEPLFNAEGIADWAQPLSKELYAKNTGDLPLEVGRIEVSGSTCAVDGFTIHTCKGFALAPGESRRLLISYRTDFCAAMVHRDLELLLVTGILVIPMKASLPTYMLSVCKKPLLGVTLWKLIKLVAFAALVASLAICIFPLAMTSGAQDCLFKSKTSTVTTISRLEKTSRPHCNTRNDRSMRELENPELQLAAGYSVCPSNVPELGSQQLKQVQDKHGLDFCGSDHKKKALLSSLSSTMKSVTVSDSSVTEIPQTSNLTVRTEREQGRRRKRRTGSGMAGAGLTGKFEASSSQSGNSTPSSPLSPLTSLTRTQTPLSPDIEHAMEASASSFCRTKQGQKEEVFVAATDKGFQEPEISVKSYDNGRLLSADQKPTVSRKGISKPVLLPSATFPCTGWRVPGCASPSIFLASSSPIAPHARAPGSKVTKERKIETDDKGGKKEFIYDIWGNHFSEFHFMGKPKESSVKISDALEGDSQSFFAGGLQSFIEKSSERSVSLVPELPTYPVNCLDQMS